MNQSRQCHQSENHCSAFCKRTIPAAAAASVNRVWFQMDGPILTKHAPQRKATAHKGLSAATDMQFYCIMSTKMTTTVETMTTPFTEELVENEAESCCAGLPNRASRPWRWIWRISRRVWCRRVFVWIRACAVVWPSLCIFQQLQQQHPMRPVALQTLQRPTTRTMTTIFHCHVGESRRNRKRPQLSTDKRRNIQVWSGTCKS